MGNEPTSYRERKVISIGVVKELTGLSERQIRYYEERKLIFPERSARGSRKYSFDDVERLMDIANQIEDGVQTFEIRQEMIRKEKNEAKKETVREDMLRGQLNAYFHMRK
ncbi:MerR family transcriptional regulator [Bacillaceae bacterium SIJ1]|uniref:MerR family transcriptional regulator n=1 Tax=Litoribacterium kuwaitense TaxID=1398745 RepID=UPI0013EA9A62|nr:MerR family transcriptional regulator [Litoribacterium kuwaitense]NGP46150.1 MerR family transcriptional regulator [Litoribacterium kuwaitense]